jgi:hypothetical protein
MVLGQSVHTIGFIVIKNWCCKPNTTRQSMAQCDSCVLLMSLIQSLNVTVKHSRTRRSTCTLATLGTTCDQRDTRQRVHSTRCQDMVSHIHDRPSSQESTNQATATERLAGW